jgi:anti-sigma factor RsiW
MEHKFMLTDELLWDYADGFLDGVEKQQVETFLRQNPDQKTRLDAILAEKRLLAEYPLETPPVDFARNVMSAWAAEQSPKLQKAQKGRDWILWGIGLTFGIMLLAPMVLLILSAPAELSVQIPEEYLPQVPSFDWAGLLNSALFRNALLFTLALMSLKILEKYLQVRHLHPTTR